jgi:hypothetical protein
MTTFTRQYSRGYTIIDGQPQKCWENYTESVSDGPPHGFPHGSLFGMLPSEFIGQHLQLDSASTRTNLLLGSASKVNGNCYAALPPAGGTTVISPEEIARRAEQSAKDMQRNAEKAAQKKTQASMPPDGGEPDWRKLQSDIKKAQDAGIEVSPEQLAKLRDLQSAADKKRIAEMNLAKKQAQSAMPPAGGTTDVSPEELERRARQAAAHRAAMARIEMSPEEKERLRAEQSARDKKRAQEEKAKRAQEEKAKRAQEESDRLFAEKLQAEESARMSAAEPAQVPAREVKKKVPGPKMGMVKRHLDNMESERKQLSQQSSVSYYNGGRVTIQEID